MPDKEKENENRRIQLEVWLSQKKMSKKELAAKLGVTESAVYGWFSNTRIPEKRWQEMKAFFCKDFEQPEPGCIAVEVSFSEEDWQKLTADIPDGTDKVDFMRQAMMRLIKAARLPEA